MTKALTTTRWEDLRFPVTSLQKGGAKEPEFKAVKTDGSGSQGVYAYWFDKATEEELFFIVQIPHAYKYGTDLHAHVHWMPSTAGAGDVVWGLEYTLCEIDAVFGNTTIETATATAAGTAFTHQILEIVQIDGSAIDSVSAMMMCRVFRDATAVADTYDNDAILLEIDFHYQIDALGSALEYTK
jgi:hypothetical protein